MSERQALGYNERKKEGANFEFYGQPQTVSDLSFCVRKGKKKGNSKKHVKSISVMMIPLEENKWNVDFEVIANIIIKY